MEGLPYDFNNEDEDEKDSTKDKPIKRSVPTAELLKETPKEVETEKVEKEEPELRPETAPENYEEIEDTAPELDAEAPLEHLSRPESEAIAQTMASERLSEIQVEEEEEVSSESLAAESFLENVEATGDINQAYSETVQELGEVAIDSSAQEVEVETETAPPIDPESLVEAAKSEINPSASYHVRRSIIEEVKVTQSPKHERREEKPIVESQPKPVDSGVIDYVVGRRHGRMADKSQHEVIERKLKEEVIQLRRELSSHESYVRQLARNRTFEKKTKARPLKVEAVKQVVVEKGHPPKPEEIKVRELAGISAHTMELSELMKVAEEVPTGESTLKWVYDTHLVGEKGLRRVVAEYLRGGDYQKALKRELVEREKDFERDPFLRDQASTMPVTSQPASLDRLLKKTGIDFGEPQPTIDQPKVKSTSLPGLIEELRKPGKPLRKLVDISMISAIIVMAVVIILLIIYR